MLVLLLLWVIGIYTMYVRAHILMRKRATDYVPGEYKAVLELAGAMHGDLDREPSSSSLSSSSFGNQKDIDTDIYALSENQLHRRITQELQGGSISFKHSLLVEGEEEEEDEKREWLFRLWLDGEKWWLVLLAGAIAGMCYCCAVARWDLVVVLVAPFCAVFAMAVGRSGRSRCVLMFWPFLLGVVPTVVLGMMRNVHMGRNE
jgi:hypothetical protein